MPASTEPRSRATPSNLLITSALIAPLVLVLAVFVYARRAERSTEAAIEQTRQHYAAVASWQFARHLGEGIHQLMDGMPELGMMMSMPQRGRHAAHASERASDSTQRTFRYDPASGIVTWDGVAKPATYSSEIAAIVAGQDAEPGDEPHRAAFVTIEGKSRAILIHAPRMHPRTITGVDADPAILEAVLRTVLARSELLPTPLARPPFGPDRIRVRVARQDGVLLAGDATAPPGASDTTDARWGGLVVTLALTPALTEALLPPSSGSRLGLPALVALLGLAILLAIAALIQLRRARELERMRSRFVANVSHELRTPLTHISMFAETLALGRERSVDERRHFSSVIHREARRLTTLVDSVLRFARAEAGDHRLQLESRPVHDDLHDALDAFAPVALNASVTTELIADASARALADAGAFRQIVLNLLDNAVKYGPAGQEVTVRAQVEGALVHITVEDRGPGIELRDRERVFDPFVRGTSTAKTPGTGIGLSVVRDLVVAQRGRVWIEPRDGGGTRVCVTLPAAPAAA